jgi:lysophospholipase L1-like esterase
VHNLNWKSYVKNALHFTSWKYTDNVRRNEYNAMLLNEYGQTGTVFDLALFEATRQDGSRVQFNGPGGKEYLALNPDYSSDGAHLNEAGAKVIAERLLLFLLENISLP